MSFGDILGIIGIAIAVVAIVVGVMATRRWGNRRCRLLFDFRSVPLMPLGTPNVRGLLKVTFRDIEVPDPHLITIRFKNVGPADIASDRFDAGEPLAVTLNCKMYGLTSNSHPYATTSTAVGANGVITLGPLLLRKGEEIVVEAIVSGASMPDLSSSLVDTDIVYPGDMRAEVAVGLLGTILEASLRRGIAPL